jgi:hypothetical protein
MKEYDMKIIVTTRKIHIMEGIKTVKAFLRNTNLFLLVKASKRRKNNVIINRKNLIAEKLILGYSKYTSQNLYTGVIKYRIIIYSNPTIHIEEDNHDFFII